MISKILFPILALCMASYAAFYVIVETPRLSSPSFPGEPASTPYPSSVCGNGIVEPETEIIAIGSPLPGTIQDVFVAVNQLVQVGDPLVRLDDREFQSQLKIRAAAVVVVEEKLNRLESFPRSEELPAKQAKLRECQAELKYESDEFERMHTLFNKRAISDSEFASSRRLLDVAQAKLATADAEFALLKAGTWKPDYLLLKAELAMAKALLEKVQCDLDRLTVRSPIEGRILQVNIHPGEYVHTPPIKSIILMGNTARLHVRVSIDEHEIDRIRENAPAKASRRGRKNKMVDLNFLRIEPYVTPKNELTGDSLELVDSRVLQVVYVVEPSESMLFVGQELDVFIEAAD